MREIITALYWLFVLGNAGLVVMSGFCGHQIDSHRNMPGARAVPVFIERGISLSFGVALASTVILSLFPDAVLRGWAPATAVLLLCAIGALAVPYFFNWGAWQIFVRSNPISSSGFTGPFRLPAVNGGGSGSSAIPLPAGAGGEQQHLGGPFHRGRTEN